VFCPPVSSRCATARPRKQYDEAIGGKDGHPDPKARAQVHRLIDAAVARIEGGKPGKRIRMSGGEELAGSATQRVR
jgi:hypothetical protein